MRLIGHPSPNLHLRDMEADKDKHGQNSKNVGDNGNAHVGNKINRHKNN